MFLKKIKVFGKVNKDFEDALEISWKLGKGFSCLENSRYRGEIRAPRAHQHS